MQTGDCILKNITDYRVALLFNIHGVFFVYNMIQITFMPNASCSVLIPQADCLDHKFYRERDLWKTVAHDFLVSTCSINECFGKAFHQYYYWHIKGMRQANLFLIHEAHIVNPLFAASLDLHLKLYETCLTPDKQDMENIYKTQ
ncbi:hypothetical protein ACJX0J_026306, partial [Zea mays]